MAITAGVQYAFAAIAGHASWIFYFHRFECHMHGLLYLQTFLLSYGGGIIALTKLYGQTTAEAFLFTSAIASSFLAGLFGSLLIWRAFLNPLNKFPGPWYTRLSNLYFTSQVLGSDAYHKLQALHEKHGRIVRIGSNDLSITDPVSDSHCRTNDSIVPITD